ncbi:MAG: cytochrome P450 [Actinomycetota bacterium]
MTFYDPSDPRWSTDPGPLFDEIRTTAPLHRTPSNYWVVTRHADCLAVLRSSLASADSLHIHPDKQPLGFNSGARQEQRELIRASGDDTRPFLFRDAPDHTRLRGLVQRAFTPRRINELEGFTRSLARDMIAPHLDGVAFDAVQSIAWALPVAVICEMLDIPAEDHAAFQHQSAQLARGLDPEFLLSDRDREYRDAAIMYFAEYFSRLFALRRSRPGPDLLSALVAAHDGEDRLSEGELLSTAILLLVAGHETTMNLISGALLALSRDQSAQAVLRAFGADRAAVDELLRFVSPVQLTGRAMTEDLSVGDQVLEEGSFVMVLLGAANRDPEVFSDPTVLNLRREPNPQLGFGFGMHHCLGSPLARLEAQVVLSELVAVSSNWHVSSPELHYRPNIVLRGLEELSLVITPA